MASICMTFENDGSLSSLHEWLAIKDDSQRCWDEYVEDASRLFVSQGNLVTAIQVMHSGKSTMANFAKWIAES